MSNKTQLQTNNAALDALITRVNAAKETAASLPEAGGSGGGNYEYCPVENTTSYPIFINEAPIEPGQTANIIRPETGLFYFLSLELPTNEIYCHTFEDFGEEISSVTNVINFVQCEVTWGDVYYVGICIADPAPGEIITLMEGG